MNGSIGTASQGTAAANKFKKSNTAKERDEKMTKYKSNAKTQKFKQTANSPDTRKVVDPLIKKDMAQFDRKS